MATHVRTSCRALRLCSGAASRSERLEKAQLGFVRDGNHEISDEDFRELTLRASARLTNLTKD